MTLCQVTMTNRFVRIYRKVRDRVGGGRKLALAIVAIWIAAELAAAVAVAVAGKAWIESAATNAGGGGSPAPGFRASLTTPSLALP
jgi:hypothetical protein